MKRNKNSNALQKAVLILQKGGIVAHATDTCYGFACDIFNKKALERLYKLKKMPRAKPISILVLNFHSAQKYGFFNKTAENLAKTHWPGALTIIVKRKKSLPLFFNKGMGTIGIRVPDHKLSQELAKKFGGPITTTSANVSGLASPYSVSAIKKQFRGRKLKPDFIIDSGVLERNLPSTVIDVSGKKIRIIRRGKY